MSESVLPGWIELRLISCQRVSVGVQPVWIGLDAGNILYRASLLAAKTVAPGTLLRKNVFPSNAAGGGSVQIQL